jgi:hypothetical protein
MDAALLSSVARQLMSRRRIKIGDETLPVHRTSRQYLKTVNFTMHGREYMAVEQNCAKPSYWAKLARAGHEVVQFIDLATGRFVGVAVDGAIKEYAGMRADRSLRKSA